MNDKNIYRKIKKMTPKEKKIYNSVIQHFPATSKESAYDVAIQGGVKWNFIPK